MDPTTIAMAAVQLAKVASLLAKMVENDGGLTEEQKAAVKQAVADANTLWENA